MDGINGKNIYIFNLCGPGGFKTGLIYQIYLSSKDSSITKETILQCSKGNSDLADEIWHKYRNLDRSVLSSYALLGIGIHPIVVDRIKNEYGIVSDLPSDDILVSKYKLKATDLEHVNELKKMALTFEKERAIVSVRDRPIIKDSNDNDCSLPWRLFLFNAYGMDGIVSRKIERLYNSLDDNEPVTPARVIEILGDIPSSQAIANCLGNINCSTISNYSLIAAGLNETAITEVSKSYGSLEDLANEFRTLNPLNLREKTLEKISIFLKANDLKLKAFSFISPENVIYDFIESSMDDDETPISTNSIIAAVHSQDHRIDNTVLYETLNLMSRKKMIRLTSSGVSIARPDISRYLKEHGKERDVAMLNMYLTDSLDSCVSYFGLTRQGVYNSVMRASSRAPLFNGEKHVHNVISNYKFTKETLDIIFPGQSTLISYVKLKYKCSPKKNELDFVFEKNLIGKKLGTIILHKNNSAIINGTLVRRDILEILGLYLNQKNKHFFNSDEIQDSFRRFLLKNGESFEELLNGVAFSTKLANSRDFLNYGKGNFFWFSEDSFSQDFLSRSRDYIENFYGYGSVEYFLKRNKALCKENGIKDEYQLFSIIKRLYEEEFKESIEFVRNPSIATRGLSRSEFFESLIEELEPIKIEKFIKYYSDRYGYKKETIAGASSVWFKDFLDHKGYLTTKLKTFDVHCKEAEAIRQFISDRPILPSCDLEKYIEKSFPKFLRQYHIRFISERIGYRYTVNATYNNKFNSIQEAVTGLGEQLGIVVNGSTLERYVPADWQIKRYSPLQSNCTFLQYSYDLFLNVGKRISPSMVIDFRDKVVGSLIEDRIYTLDELLHTSEYTRILDSYPEIDELIIAMGQQLLISILGSSDSISSLHDTEEFVFGKGKQVTIKRIVKALVDRNESLEQAELYEILGDKYGIDAGFTAGYYYELGLYFDPVSMKIYKSKEIADNELVSYLEGGGESDGLENE